MGMCCSDDQKKAKKGHHGPDQNPFKGKTNVQIKTEGMVTDAIGVVTQSEEVTISGGRVVEGEVQGRIMDDTIVQIVDTAGDQRVGNEHGWLGMYNDKVYGEKHQYYHLEMPVMAEMTMVHFDCPEFAGDYLKNHRNSAMRQGIWFDMEMTVNAGTMQAFAKLLSQYDHLQDVNLVFYENKNLNLDVFKMFMNALSQQKNLRRLNVNLRWCQQVTDEYIESLAQALPETLESLELWVLGCHRLTNRSLGAMFENMQRCNQL